MLVLPVSASEMPRPDNVETPEAFIKLFWQAIELQMNMRGRVPPTILILLKDRMRLMYVDKVLDKGKDALIALIKHIAGDEESQAVAVIMQAAAFEIDPGEAKDLSQQDMAKLMASNADSITEIVMIAVEYRNGACAMRQGRVDRTGDKPTIVDISNDSLTDGDLSQMFEAHPNAPATTTLQ